MTEMSELPVTTEGRTLSRHRFLNDYYQFYVRDSGRLGVGSDHMAEIGFAPERPTDGLVMPLPRQVLVHSGDEMGPVNVDVAWSLEEPEGVYEIEGFASACDIDLASGTLLLADGYGRVVARHSYGSATRLRVLVSAKGREVQPWQNPVRGMDPNLGEIFTVVTWPISSPEPWWCNERYDKSARDTLTYMVQGVATSEPPPRLT